jgi:very-short-patch-repair endonuclease
MVGVRPTGCGRKRKRAMNTSAQGTFAIDSALRGIAVDQLGLLSAAQALRVGVDYRALARRRQSGSLMPVFANVVRLGSWPTSAEQRSLGAALAVPGATIAGIDAAVIHKIPIPKAVRNTQADVHLHVEQKRIVRIKGICARRVSRPLPTQHWHGVKLATPASTLVSLGGLGAQDVFERALDHCLINKMVTAHGVVALLEGLTVRALPGRGLMLDIARKRLPNDRNRVLHRSKLEQDVGGWLNAGGVKGWSANFTVRLGTGRTIEIDFAWPDQKVALEVSPFHTHGSQKTQERDAQRRRLLILLGWRIVEALDADLVDVNAFEATILTLSALIG